jgi:acyl carrier protein
VALERQAVVNFLNKRTRADLSVIADDTALFSTGIIDSFTMVDLLMWLEKQTGSRVGPEDVSVEKLDTVARILSFAAERTKQA